MTTDELIERLRAVDHMSVEECFLDSFLFAKAADALTALKAERDALRAAPSWTQFNYADPVQAVRTRDSAPEFPGFVIGWYERLDGHRGYVLQHDPRNGRPSVAYHSFCGEHTKKELP